MSAYLYSIQAKPIAAAIFGICFFLQFAYANDNHSRKIVIEEVIVTAQKREQSIFDVPISIMAVDDEFLSEKGISDFSELSNYIPNVKMRTDSGTGVNLNIRGFSKQSGNVAFDQAVGLLVDGVPYNDNDFFVAGMVDIARIEVLRGPQGTLLGKNTTAGLVNITTKNPSDEFDAYIDLQSGEYDQERLEAAAGGPLIPGLLNIRIAALSDKRDGVFENTTKTEDPRSIIPGVPDSELIRDREVLRVKLSAPNLFNSEWELQYETSNVVALGNGTEIIDIDSDSEEYLRQFDPNLDVTPNNFTGSVNDPHEADRSVDKIVGRWNKGFHEWNIQAVVGQATVDGGFQGADPTPAPLFGFVFLTDKKQDNFDFLITSPPVMDGRLNITSGVFYERRVLDIDDTLVLNTEPTVALLLADNPNNSLILPPSVLPASATIIPGDDFTQENTHNKFYQETEDMAVYGQIDIQLLDEWSLIGGFRYSVEEKSATWNRTFNSASTVLLTEVLGYEEFSTERKRSEETFQPKIAVNYRPLEEVSIFMHWARGYRSGGFNAAAGRNAGLEYEREVVDEYAVNAKTRLFEGRLTFNIGLFYMDLEDFQLLTVGPDDLAAVAVNAGSARAKGVEADMVWLANEWLTLSAAVGYNDAVFTEFPFGPCPKDRPNFDGDNDPRCDLTGSQLPNSPDWTVSAAINIDVPLLRLGINNDFFSGWRIIGGVNVEYQTVSTTGLPGDDRFTQPEYARWGLSAGVGADNWAFRVTGKNLSNESVNRFVGYIPTTDNLVQSVEPPKTIYAQFRWNY